MSGIQQSLRHICLAGGPRPVALRSDEEVTADELRQQVLSVAAGLVERSEQRWALWFASPYEFLVAFLAASLAGKRIVLPGNMQEGTARLLAPAFDGLLSHEGFEGLDCPQLGLACVARANTTFTPNLAADVDIVLFTSGSTGEPKAVAKRLSLLEAELRVQQLQWGGELGTMPVVATVSHQHIYGLLHVVLWPFLRGAPFIDEICQYPEELIAQVVALRKAVLVSSPTHLARLPQVPVAHQARGRFMAVFSSGGLLRREPALAVTELVGRAPIEILGSTETGGVAWRQQTNAEDSQRWQPLPGVAINQNEQQCLAVSAPHTGLGESFVMGDRVSLCSDGSFKLLGRADQIVKVEGKRLSLTEMQQRLEADPRVQQACLAVVTTAKREEVGAVVVLTAEGRDHLVEQGKLALNCLLQHTLLAYFERPLLPRRWRYVEELPYNVQGKLTVDVLQQLLQRET